MFGENLNKITGNSIQNKKIKKEEKYFLVFYYFIIIILVSLFFFFSTNNNKKQLNVYCFFIFKTQYNIIIPGLSYFAESV